MYHRLIDNHPLCCSCPRKHLCHHPPPAPEFTEVLVQGHTVTVVECDCAAQVQEVCGRFQGICIHTDSKMTGFKTMLNILPPSLLPPPNKEIVQIKVPITEAPQRDLYPTPLTFRERGGILLQDTQAIPPVL